MTGDLFALVASAGLPAIAAAAFLACLGVPIPAFVLLMAGGAFAASGDLVLWQVLAVGWLSAVGGDLTGYQLGRRGGRALLLAAARRSGKGALVARAEDLADRMGGPGVFLSRWLVSPLGPWVNLAAGAARYDRRRFALWDIAGEAVWVGGYVTLGHVFAAEVDRLAGVAADWAGFATSGAVAAGLAVLLARQVRRRPRAARGGGAGGSA